MKSSPPEMTVRLHVNTESHSAGAARLIHVELIVVLLAFAGQSSARHEPIYSADRVFTAEEFRQHLAWIRGQQKILDAVQNSRLSPEDQKKMADFAQRLLEKSQAGEKADFPIPQKLLKDPAVQNLLNDQKFLEWLANNEQMQKTAERLASRFQLPMPPTPPSSDSNKADITGSKQKLDNRGYRPGARKIGKETPNRPSAGKNARLDHDASTLSKKTTRLETLPIHPTTTNIPRRVQLALLRLLQNRVIPPAMQMGTSIRQQRPKRTQAVTRSCDA